MTQNERASRIQQEIDRNLKRVYDDVLHEDVPQRFDDLLRRLRTLDTTCNDKGETS